jgi:hypothetical protein
MLVDEGRNILIVFDDEQANLAITRRGRSIISRLCHFGSVGGLHQILFVKGARSARAKRAHGGGAF